MRTNLMKQFFFAFGLLGSLLGTVSPSPAPPSTVKHLVEVVVIDETVNKIPLTKFTYKLTRKPGGPVISLTKDKTEANVSIGQIEAGEYSIKSHVLL